MNEHKSGRHNHTGDHNRADWRHVVAALLLGLIGLVVLSLAAALVLDPEVLLVQGPLTP